MVKKEWRYNKIRTMDISNGPGVRVSLFTQGCLHMCKDCFNEETWDFDLGNIWNDEVNNNILNYMEKDYVEGLSILGGDPFAYYNDTISEIYDDDDKLYKLVKTAKKHFPEKNIWLWTGYRWEEFTRCDDSFSNKVKKVLPYIDVIVDGKFMKEFYDSSLLYRGSKNQRVLNVQKLLTELSFSK